MRAEVTFRRAGESEAHQSDDVCVKKENDVFCVQRESCGPTSHTELTGGACWPMFPETAHTADSVTCVRREKVQTLKPAWTDWRALLAAEGACATDSDCVCRKSAAYIEARLN